MTNNDEPEANDTEWLRARLRRQADDVTVDAPPESGLHRRIASRKRRRIGTSAMAFALVAGGLGIGAVSLLGDDGDNNRVQVASPDAAEQSQDDTVDGGRGVADEEARDRSGSGLVFSPLPLETTTIELPLDSQAWQLFVDGEYLYTAGPDGWLLRTDDLENWESLPTPPLAELIPQIDDEAGWPNHHFMQSAVSGDVIAALVNVFDASGFDLEGGDHVIESTEDAEDQGLDVDDDGWFAYAEDLETRCSHLEAPVGADSMHLVVSRDGGTTWSATELDSPLEDVAGDFIVPHHQAELAVSNGAVLVSSTVFQHLELDCLIHDAGLVPAGRTSTGLSYGGARIELNLDDGTTVTTTADELGLTPSQRAAMEHDDNQPFTLSVLTSSGLDEVHSGVGYPEMVGTSAGFLVTTFGVEGIRSADGGRTWTDVELPGWIHDPNGSTLVASDGFSSFLSDDLGTTWTRFDGPDALQIQSLARNGEHLLVAGHEAFGDMDLDYELDLSLTKDGRTLRMHQAAATLTITVIDDTSGEVLFETEGDLFNPEPPPGTEETPDGGIRVLDADGATVFEASEDELNAAFEATMPENGGFDDVAEYEEPELVFAHSAGDGWSISPSTDVLGANSWIMAVVPWADGFVVVANTIPEMAFDPSEFEDGEGTIVGESYDFEPPQLVVLTPG